MTLGWSRNQRRASEPYGQGSRTATNFHSTAVGEWCLPKRWDPLECDYGHHEVDRRFVDGETHCCSGIVHQVMEMGFESMILGVIDMTHFILLSINAKSMARGTSSVSHWELNVQGMWCAKSTRQWRLSINSEFLNWYVTVNRNS